MKHEFTMPIRTRSMANARLHWAAKMRAARAERETAMLLFRNEINRGNVKPPVASVSLTRFGLKLMDGDNLQTALKHVRDGIADALGVADGPGGIRWSYAQERVRKREHVGVKVLVDKENDDATT